MELNGTDQFSPIGDVIADKARYTIDLARRAKVTIKVVDTDHNLVRGPVRLGEHRGGTTLKWVWDGRDNSGDRAPDHGHYRVRAMATTPAGKVVTDEHWLVLDTEFDASLESNFDTVYPRSKAVTDRVRFGTRGGDDLGKATLQIRRPGGKLVFSKTAGWTRGYPYEVAFPVAWNGRDNDGRVLPAGNYFARVKGRDWVGNAGKTKRIPLHVSASRLTEATATVDISPADSRIPYNPCENSTANGCGDFPPCGEVVASTSYPANTDPGALSYRSSIGCGTYAYQDFAVAWHAVPRPVDSPRGTALVSVSMRGKPTNAGESDVATLGGNTSATSPATTQESTTTAEGTSSVTAQDLVRGPAARWAVKTTGDNWFDVASFHVTYRYLKPVP